MIQSVSALVLVAAKCFAPIEFSSVAADDDGEPFGCIGEQLARPVVVVSTTTYPLTDQPTQSTTELTHNNSYGRTTILFAQNFGNEVFCHVSLSSTTTRKPLIHTGKAIILPLFPNDQL